MLQEGKKILEILSDQPFQAHHFLKDYIEMKSGLH
jgi:hypothetical protein